MEIRQIRYFLSVADKRSFVSAAESLYISRQAVSKAISQLESELGVTLFVRDTSGAFLTPTGLLFYERIRGIIMELDSLTEQIRATSSRYLQRIRIAFSVGTVSLLEDSLLSFRDSSENLDVVYSEHSQDDCFHMLQEHQADIMISGLKNPSPQFLSQEIISSPLGVLVRSAEGMDDLDQLDVSELSWIPIGAPTDKQIQEYCAKHRIAASYQGEDFHRLFSLVLSGKCALILPQCLIPGEIPGLHWIPLRQQENWKLYCTYSQSAESDILFSFVLEELSQHVLQLRK